MTARSAIGACVLLACLVPAVTEAQATTSNATTGTVEGSRVWVVAGAAFTAVRSDCQTCEEESPYRHAAGVLGNAGYRLSERLDVGAELFWVPVETASGRARMTHIDAVAQFRPWRSQGFFVKGGAGMAFLRNWVDAVGPSPINQKALSVVIGTGWVFRPNARIGVQVVAAQHAGAVGDVKTATADLGDVLSNFWSLGAAIVIR